MSNIAECSVENLIAEVEKRPALYNKALKEYSDVNIKKKLWDEVCAIVVPAWGEMDAEDRRKQGKFIQVYIML